jgi:hypothetical protein
MAGDRVEIPPHQVHEHDFAAHLRPRESALVDPAASGQRSVNEALLARGIMPALYPEQIPATLAHAAQAMKGSNLSLPGDRNLSSASAVSQILSAAGEKVKPTTGVTDLKQQLLNAGWEEIKAQPPRPGDIRLTPLNGFVHKAAIVGMDNHTYSHDVNRGALVGKREPDRDLTVLMRKMDKK